MRPLHVAILGQGRSGYSIHGCFFLRGTEKFRVTHVVDLLPERRAKAAAAFGCATHQDYHDLFACRDIDLVVNALPSPLHYPVTLEFLRAGFNVLSEKPGAATPAQIDEMDAAARENGVMLAFFQQSRFAPYFRTIKRTLASGVLGRVVQISVAFDGFQRRWDWQTLQENCAGSLFNTGPHPLDQALDLLGGTAMPDVMCRMDRVNTFGDAEDYVKLIMTVPGGPLVDLSISSCNAYPSGTYNLHCQYGGLWSDQKRVAWRWYDPAEAPAQRLIRTPLTTPEGEPAYCGEKLIWHEDEWIAGENETSFIAAVESIYDNLYDRLTTGAPLTVTPAQVRRQIEVINICHAQNSMPRLDD